MSLGPLPALIPSAAGAPLAQTKGAEVERAQQAAAVSEHQLQSQQKAETAAGIGQPDGDDHQTDQRDADGRRPWDLPARRDDAGEKQDEGGPAPPKDPTGQSGSLLDLAG
jgi:hypothetical protein